MRIAAIQFTCALDPLVNIDRAIELAEKAVDRGAKLVAFQQLFHAPWFPLQRRKDNFKYGLTLDSEEVRMMRDTARSLSCALSCPIFELDEQGKGYNTCLLIDSAGMIIGSYRKTHIPRLKHYEEDFYFSPGGDLPVFDVDGLKVGVALCWDNFYPEVHRTLALKGAQVIIAPTAAGLKSEDRWMVTMAGQAMVNNLYILRINRVGKEGSLQFYGDSFCANPVGELLYESTGEENAVYLVDIDTDLIAQSREVFPYFQGRRPGLYKTLSSARSKMPKNMPTPLNAKRKDAVGS